MIYIHKYSFKWVVICNFAAKMKKYCIIIHVINKNDL